MRSGPDLHFDMQLVSGCSRRPCHVSLSLALSRREKYGWKMHVLQRKILLFLKESLSRNFSFSLVKRKKNTVFFVSRYKCAKFYFFCSEIHGWNVKNYHAIFWVCQVWEWALSRLFSSVSFCEFRFAIFFLFSLLSDGKKQSICNRALSSHERTKISARVLCEFYLASVFAEAYYVWMPVDIIYNFS